VWFLIRLLSYILLTVLGLLSIYLGIFSDPIQRRAEPNAFVLSVAKVQTVEYMELA
jgi:hypothetical protein